MRLGLTLLLSAVCLCAQSAPDPDVARAQAGIEKLRALVAAGAAPRNQLDKAEDALADAQDSAILRKTLYGQDLTVEQSDEMIAAAERRFERRKKAYDQQKKLVDAGVVSLTSLNQFVQDMDLAQKESEMAQTRSHLTEELAAMARAEDSAERLAQTPAPEGSKEGKTMERFDGDGVFTPATFTRVETAFEQKFGKPLPVSAMGETAVHRALGFDHRGRVDVAVNPDQPEGVWLRDYLTGHNIPFYAFRHAVPGKATGAHIHMGPGSTRIANGG
ncbi:MAG TPA: hypothetical protein VGF59_14560 [Bryobacteraceae bacterium]|jgi:hypothetical protein